MAAPKLQRWIDLLAALLRRRLRRPVRGTGAGGARVPAGHAEQAGAPADVRARQGRLRAFGVPIETVLSPEGETEGYRLVAKEFYLPYLSMVVEGRKTAPKRVDRYGYKALATLAFEPDELAAVAEAAVRVRALGVPELAGLAESACRKLAFDLPVDAARAAEVQVAGGAAGVQNEVFDTLAGALERRKRVTFRYRSMGRDEEAERTVEPLGLFFLGQHWYLAARAPGEELVKNYRLSRMTGAAVNGQAPGTPDYTVPAAFSLQKHAKSRQAWELGDGDAMLAEVSFDARSGPARAAARLGAPVRGHADRRKFQVRRMDAFARWLLSLAGDATPVAPSELIAEYRAIAQATLERYDR